MDGFVNHDGRGVCGVDNDHAVLVGRRSWPLQEWWSPPDLSAQAKTVESLGYSPVWVAWYAMVRGVIVVADTIKDTASAIPSSVSPGCDRSPHGGQHPRRSRSRGAGRHRPRRFIAEALLGDKVSAVNACRPRERTGPWWATAATTPRLSP